MSHRIPFPNLARYGLAVTSLFLVSLALSCKPVSKGDGAEPLGDKPTGAVSPAAPAAELFGNKLGDSPEVTLAQVLQSPAEYSGKTVRLEGHVRRACSAKGCWMELAASKEPNASACRVTFKDYGFFVPTDSAGAQARVEGEVTLKRVRAAHVRHYEGEGATFASKHEDGSADEVRFVATGVELRR